MHTTGPDQNRFFQIERGTDTTTPTPTGSNHRIYSVRMVAAGLGAADMKYFCGKCVLCVVCDSVRVPERPNAVLGDGTPADGYTPATFPNPQTNDPACCITGRGPFAPETRGTKQAALKQLGPKGV